MPDRVRVPNRMPTTRGVSITSAPGAIISAREACKERQQHECMSAEGVLGQQESNIYMHEMTSISEASKSATRRDQ